MTAESNPESKIARDHVNASDVNLLLPRASPRRSEIYSPPVLEDRDEPTMSFFSPWPGKTAVTCSHPNNDPIMRLAAELDVHVYIHTWLKVGGSPRLPGGDNLPSESTPMDVAKLAQRFPNVMLICGHSGGDWELGVRAVRPYRNVFLEFSGSDPHSGMVDYAIRELGVDRLVWGGHGPSRSYATELGKVLDADISTADRMKIFGGNLRRICAPIFHKKGMKIEL